VFRILRAFAWMRWRILLNSFERTGTRDTLERLSLAIEQIGPLIGFAVLVPSLVVLFALAIYGGFSLARDAGARIELQALRFLAFAALCGAVIGPIVLPGGERTNAIRLLLLPIPRGTLYSAQAAGGLMDPWTLLVLPVVLGMPVGLAAGGAPGSAVIALAAGALFVLVIVGVSTLTAGIAQLVVRDRRRGELVALLFVVIIPLIGALPALFDPSFRRHARADSGHRDSAVPAWVFELGRQAFALLPSELYTSAARPRAEADATGTATALMLLGATAFLLHGSALLIFGKLLDSPAQTGARRSSAAAAAMRRIPGLSVGASAIALAQIRLALRTPRGRSVMLSPLVVFTMFAIMLRRAGSDSGFTLIQGGLSLATFGSFVSLLASLPLAMNQFAVDGAGLTLSLLSPISDMEILLGKAVGNGVIALAPALVCVTVAYVAFPSGSVPFWIAIPLGLLATYVLAAPAAAAASAVFPKAADMNTIRSGSNAHGAAGLLGMVTYAAAAVVPISLVLGAAHLLRMPALAPVLVAVWCAAAFVISRLLFVPVARLLARRRENLGMVVG
jgi:hypothetical protein